MRGPSLIFCTFFLLSTTSVFSQINNSYFNIPKTEEASTYSVPANSSELVDKRGQYQKAYKTNDGRIIYEYSKSPLNYKASNGAWMPIDLRPTPTTRGFLADKQTNPVALGYDGSVEVANSEGSVFSLSTTKVFNEVITDEPIANKNINPSLVTNNNQYFTFLTEQVIQRSEFKHNGIKVDYIFPQAVNTGTGIIQQQLNCKSTWKLVEHKMVSHALSIQNEKGEEMGILYPIVCKDANGNTSLGDYTFQKNEQGFLIGLQINNEWFNAADRTFPVIVDPLIIGPTAVFGAVYIPSCVLPSYGVDSLLVTIPGQTTITGVFCSGNYYADPWAGAIKAEGFMHFSSTCGSAADLSIYPPNTGWNTAGAAIATDFDYRSPLTCCLGPSCVDRTFYVRLHIGRNAGGPGCNTSYIYYDPFVGYPFSVFVEGRSVESTATQWVVTPAIVCSDQCSLNLKSYVRYGVPPFTVTHPWASGSVNVGAPIYSCSLNGFSSDLTLTRPNCPVFCDTTTSINIPFPTITDACGNTVSGLPVRLVDIKPTPQITIATDSILVCSSEPVLYPFNVCPAGTNVDWTAPGFFGSNTIDTTYNNPGPGVSSTTYTANAILNGCTSTPQNITYYVSPNPLAAASHPAVGFIAQPIDFIDMSNYVFGSGSTWFWTFGDGASSTDSAATHIYLASGTYNVCLYITSDLGCLDTICDTIKIIPNEIILPNVITINNDGINDVLYFQYLPYYGVSTLQVYDRWGVVVFESSDYQNDWAPTNLVDGTYFYIIKIPGHEPYTSTLNIFSKP